MFLLVNDSPIQRTSLADANLEIESGICSVWPNETGGFVHSQGKPELIMLLSNLRAENRSLYRPASLPALCAQPPKSVQGEEGKRKQCSAWCSSLQNNQSPTCHCTHAVPRLPTVRLAVGVSC